jgi:chromosome segregation ATPase
VLSTGSLLTWGDGSHGQLGHGKPTAETAQLARPRRVTALLRVKIESAVCGSQHTLALSSDGQVFSFGRGAEGQLGLGESVREGLTPALITGLSAVDVREVAAGRNVSVALTMDGQVYTWGDGRAGQLGQLDYSVRWEPTEVASLAAVRVVEVAAGGAHVAVVTENASVMVCGSLADGRLGVRPDLGIASLNKFTPVALLADRSVHSVSCSDAATLVIVSQGIAPSTPGKKVSLQNQQNQQPSAAGAAGGGLPFSPSPSKPPRAPNADPAVESALASKRNEVTALRTTMHLSVLELTTLRNRTAGVRMAIESGQDSSEARTALEGLTSKLVNQMATIRSQINQGERLSLGLARLGEDQSVPAPQRAEFTKLRQEVAALVDGVSRALEEDPPTIHHHHHREAPPASPAPATPIAEGRPIGRQDLDASAASTPARPRSPQSALKPFTDDLERHVRRNQEMRRELEASRSNNNNNSGITSHSHHIMNSSQLRGVSSSLLHRSSHAAPADEEVSMDSSLDGSPRRTDADALGSPAGMAIATSMAVAELDALRALVAGKDEELGRFSRIVEEKERQVVNLGRELAVKTGLLTAAEGEGRLAMKEVRHFVTEVGILGRETEELREELREARAEAERLRGLEAKLAGAAERAARVDRLEEEVATLARDRAEAQQTVARAQESLKQLSNETQGQMRVLQREHQSTLAALEAEKAGRQAAVMELAVAKTAALRASEGEEAARAALAAAESARAGALARAEAAEEALKEGQERAEGEARAHQAAMEHLTAARDAIVREQDLRARADEELTRRVRRGEELEAEITDLRRERDRARADALANDTSALTQALRDQVTYLEGLVMSSEGKHRALDAQLQARNAELQALSQALFKSGMEREEMVAQADRTAAELAACLARCRSMEAEAAEAPALRRRLAECEDRLARSEARAAALEAGASERSALSAQLDRLTEELALRAETSQSLASQLEDARASVRSLHPAVAERDELRERCALLAGDLQASQARAASLDSEAQRARERAGALETSLRDATQELSVMRVSLAHMESESSRYAAQAEALTARCAELSAELSLQRDTGATQAARVATLDAEVARLAADVTKAADLLSAQQQSLDASERAAEATKGAVASLTEREAWARGRLKEYEALIEQLQQEHAAGLRELDAQRAACARAESLADQRAKAEAKVNEALAAATEALSAARADASALSRKLATHEADAAAAVREERVRAEAASSAFAREREALEARVKSSEATATALGARNKALSDQAHMLLEQVTELQNTGIGASQRLSESTARVEYLGEAKADLELRIDALTTHVSALEADNRDLANAMAQMAGLPERAEHLQRRVAQLEAELIEGQEAQQALELKVRDHEVQNEVHRDRARESALEAQTLREDNGSLAREARAAREEAARLSHMLQRLQGEHSQAVAELNDTREANNRSVRAIDELRSGLHDAEAAEARASELEVELRQVKSRRDSLAREVESLSAALEQLRHENHTLETRLEDLAGHGPVWREMKRLEAVRDRQRAEEEGAASSFSVMEDPDLSPVRPSSAAASHPKVSSTPQPRTVAVKPVSAASSATSSAPSAPSSRAFMPIAGPDVEPGHLLYQTRSERLYATLESTALAHAELVRDPELTHIESWVAALLTEVGALNERLALAEAERDDLVSRGGAPRAKLGKSNEGELAAAKALATRLQAELDELNGKAGNDDDDDGQEGRKAIAGLEAKLVKALADKDAAEARWAEVSGSRRELMARVAEVEAARGSLEGQVLLLEAKLGHREVNEARVLGELAAYSERNTALTLANMELQAKLDLGGGASRTHDEGREAARRRAAELSEKLSEAERRLASSEAHAARLERDCAELEAEARRQRAAAAAAASQLALQSPPPHLQHPPNDSALRTLRAELEQVTAELAVARSVAARRPAEATPSEVDSLRRQLAALQGELEGARLEALRATHRAEALSTSSRASDEERARWTDQVVSLQSQVSGLTQQNNVLLLEIRKSLDSTASRGADERVRQLELERENLVREMSVLRGTVASLQEHRAQADARLAEASARASALSYVESEMARLNGDLAQTQGELAMLRQSGSEATAHLQAALTAARLEEEAASARARTLEASGHTLREELAAARRQLHEVAKSFDLSRRVSAEQQLQLQAQMQARPLSSASPSLGGPVAHPDQSQSAEVIRALRAENSRLREDLHRMSELSAPASASSPSSWSPTFTQGSRAVVSRSAGADRRASSPYVGGLRRGSPFLRRAFRIHRVGGARPASAGTEPAAQLAFTAADVASLLREAQTHAEAAERLREEIVQLKASAASIAESGGNGGGGAAETAAMPAMAAPAAGSTTPVRITGSGAGRVSPFRRGSPQASTPSSHAALQSGAGHPNSLRGIHARVAGLSQEVLRHEIARREVLDMVDRVQGEGHDLADEAGYLMESVVSLKRNLAEKNDADQALAAQVASLQAALAVERDLTLRLRRDLEVARDTSPSLGSSLSSPGSVREVDRLRAKNGDLVRELSALELLLTSAQQSLAGPAKEEAAANAVLLSEYEARMAEWEEGRAYLARVRDPAAGPRFSIDDVPSLRGTVAYTTALNRVLTRQLEESSARLASLEAERAPVDQLLALSRADSEGAVQALKASVDDLRFTLAERDAEITSLKRARGGAGSAAAMDPALERDLRDQIERLQQEVAQLRARLAEAEKGRAEMQRQVSEAKTFFMRGIDTMAKAKLARERAMAERDSLQSAVHALQRDNNDLKARVTAMAGGAAGAGAGAGHNNSASSAAGNMADELKILQGHLTDAEVGILRGSMARDHRSVNESLDRLASIGGAGGARVVVSHTIPTARPASPKKRGGMTGGGGGGGVSRSQAGSPSKMQPKNKPPLTPQQPMATGKF